MIEVIKEAIAKGAKLYSNVSGGKDGQAMTKILLDHGFPVAGLVHADLGRTEWPQSIVQCRKLSEWHDLPLHIATRRDGVDMLGHWENRMKKLQFKASDISSRKEILVSQTPFWSSKSNRYCTSDLKRDVINVFYNSTGNDFIISCEGIRADESTDRAKKVPLTIRDRVTSTYYDGMTVEEAVANFKPGKKLVLTWYPIFNFTLDEVWNTYGNTQEQLEQFRIEYNKTGLLNMGYIHDPTWNFHPAYVYGNDRVSCMICILGSEKDIRNGAKHNPELYEAMVKMEWESGFTFRKDFSLETLSKIKKPSL